MTVETLVFYGTVIGGALAVLLGQWQQRAMWRGLWRRGLSCPVCDRDRVAAECRREHVQPEAVVPLPKGESIRVELPTEA